MTHFIKIMTVSVIVLFFALAGFIYEESSVAEAVSLSPQTDAVVVTLNVLAEITISNAPDITMSNSIGVTNTTAVGTSTFTVITNNSLGYFLGVKANNAPAMRVSSTQFVDDFSTTSMPTTWSVPSNGARFGFSAFGTDVLTRYGTGSFCNGAATSTVSSTLNYYGFYINSTTTSNRSSTTTPSGVNTTICYAAQEGTAYFIPSGTYTATITATATVN